MEFPGWTKWSKEEWQEWIERRGEQIEMGGGDVGRG
jgi:hypothetical protein